MDAHLTCSRPWALQSNTSCQLCYAFYIVTRCSLKSFSDYFIPCHPFSTPPKIHVHFGSNTLLFTVAESIQCYQNIPQAATFQMSPILLQLPCPSASVHLHVVSNGSASGSHPDTVSPESQSPIPSSAYCMHCSWAVPSFWPINSLRIQFALDGLGLWLQQLPNPIDHCSHYLYHIDYRTVQVMGASPHSLPTRCSAALQLAGNIQLAGWGGVCKVRWMGDMSEYSWKMSAGQQNCFQGVLEVLEAH